MRSNEAPASLPVTAKRACCVIFLHIPKTGGRTMRAVLQFKYPSETIILYALSEGLEKLEEIPIEQRRAARIVTGHFPHGAHRFMPQPCEYITFLRDPVARVLSRYYAVESRIGRPGHWSFDDLGRTSMTLEEWIGLAGDPIENFQTRLVSGRARGERVGRNELEEAKTNLEQFLVVGLTERFDESFVLVRRALGWKLPLYATRNARRFREGGARRAEPSDEVLEMIRERNALDIELYDHAEQLLDAGIDRAGPSFHRELVAFRGFNRIPQKVGPYVPRRLRTRIGSILAR